MSFDVARGVSTIHGGDSSFQLQDTLEFDGAIWKEVDYGGVSPREGHALAYDSMRDVTVMFGGVYNDDNVNEYYDQTFEWNGHIKKWTWRDVAVRPSKRARHMMVYDDWRNVCVLYGGSDGDGLKDTWEWDGSAWIKRLGSSPPGARVGHAMVFDSWRGVCVIWSSGGNNQMWEWDGETWRGVDQGTTVPSARAFHAMAFDSKRGVIVVYGGRSGSTVYSDTWEYTPCYPDCERDCDLDIFDYLCFQDKFIEGHPYADFERDGDLDIFDFLKFQDEYIGGCG